MKKGKQDNATREEVEDIEAEEQGQNTKLLRQIIANWANAHIKPADRKTNDHKSGIHCFNVRFQHLGSIKNVLDIKLGDREADPDNLPRTIEAGTINAVQSEVFNPKDIPDTIDVKSDFTQEYSESFKLAVGSKLGFGIKAGVPCVDISFEAEVGLQTEKLNQSTEKNAQEVHSYLTLPANSKQKIIRHTKAMEMVETFLVPITLTGNVILYFNHETAFDDRQSEFVKVKAGLFPKITAIEVPVASLFADRTIVADLAEKGLLFRSVNADAKVVILAMRFTRTSHQRNFELTTVGHPEPLQSPPVASLPNAPGASGGGKTMKRFVDAADFSVNNADISGDSDAIQQNAEIIKSLATQALQAPLDAQALEQTSQQIREHRAHQAQMLAANKPEEAHLKTSLSNSRFKMAFTTSPMGTAAPKNTPPKDNPPLDHDDSHSKTTTPGNSNNSHM